MEAKKYEAARRLVEGCKGADYAGPFPEELVVRAEDVLGVRFPPSYRRFLQDFGCLSVSSEEIYGIVDEDLLRGPVPNGIWATLDERKKFGLEKQFVILGSTGSGGWYALDTSRADTNGECPVDLRRFV
jgi:hypothetical protein